MITAFQLGNPSSSDGVIAVAPTIAWTRASVGRSAVRGVPDEPGVVDRCRGAAGGGGRGDAVGVPPAGHAATPCACASSGVGAVGGAGLRCRGGWAECAPRGCRWPGRCGMTNEEMMLDRLTGGASEATPTVARASRRGGSTPLTPSRFTSLATSFALLKEGSAALCDRTTNFTTPSLLHLPTHSPRIAEDAGNRWRRWRVAEVVGRGRQRGARRAVDDPLTLASAARIVRAALARRALSDNQAAAAGHRRKADRSPPNVAAITPSVVPASGSAQRVGRRARTNASVSAAMHPK